MAGMRIGYAIGQADSVRPLARYKMPYNVSTFGVAAAIASLNDQKHIDDERARTKRDAFGMEVEIRDLPLQPIWKHRVVGIEIGDELTTRRLQRRIPRGCQATRL